ncbi:armadillo repeat-containing protein 3-like isoform X5 [Talpa occidentalis]|uniref:armadillo repeat-containing protein 3-like isoform X5 n=1 Tax=Talpa occidentalis TaxID=50954 RepID=UPI0018909874|nr:armadillo repeat-containing protein 3-like isoform X5 [Talpa occidentalis]
MGKKIKKEAEPPHKDVFDPLTVESRNVATVVLMLNSPEEEILAKACEGIYRFALKGEENKTTLLELGAVEPLTKLLTHEDKIVRRNANMIFGILTSNSDVKKLLRELDILNSVIAQLAPEEEVIIHEFASLCLANMSAEYTSKVQIFECGGLEPLVRLLSSPDPDVKKNSIECIYNLVQDLNDLHIEALLVIANCLDDMDTMALIQQTGGLKKLLTFAENSAIPDIQKNAAKAITKAAYNSENRKFFHEQEVEKCLIALLGSENDGTKIAASQAISAMCENTDSKKVFNTQGIPQLIQLLKSDNEEVGEAAALALANLTTCSPANAKKSEWNESRESCFQCPKSGCGNQPVYHKGQGPLLPAHSAVAEADGIGPLINILASKRDGAIAYAATALTNMATLEPLRVHMQTRGIMQALLGPLHSANTVVQSKAALAVAATASDFEARTELRNLGGLQPLVELLRSKNSEVRRHASWAVMVCAGDELMATEFFRLGTLDILEEINLSVTRQNKFSEAAYNKLLNNNLSLKYSQTGYLSSSNIISDGFYDYGRINRGTKLLPLKELCLQEPSGLRTILLINSKPSDVKNNYHYSAGTGSPTEEKSEPTSGRNTALSSKSAIKERALRKSQPKQDVTALERKAKGEKEEEKYTGEGSPEKECYPPCDPDFCVYVHEVTKSILPITNIKEQIETLAKYVAEKMGGKVSKEKLNEFNWEHHISELKFQLKSNVIPIGLIKKGIFYHRALLFKALADKIGVGCSLARGEYGRAWNEVKLLSETRKGVIGGVPPLESTLPVSDYFTEKGHYIISSLSMIVNNSSCICIF